MPKPITRAVWKVRVLMHGRSLPLRLIAHYQGCMHMLVTMTGGLRGPWDG